MKKVHSLLALLMLSTSLAGDIAFAHDRDQNHYDYSGFDSALYRIVDAQWHFPQENATGHDLPVSTRESKPL